MHHLWIQIQVNICSERTPTQRASTSKETEVSGSDDDEGTEDEEEDGEIQRHKETEDAEDEEGVEEEAEDEEIGQEKAEGGEMQKMMNRTKSSKL